MTQLFLDSDGVIADLDGGHLDLTGVTLDRPTIDVDWDLVARTPNFFANLPLRSGTWATVRMARRINLPVTLVRRDGTLYSEPR